MRTPRGPRTLAIGALVVCALLLVCLAPLAARDAADVRVVDAVARVGAYVEQYYARAQSIVAQETVTLQPLQADLSADGFARRLVYELRLEWNPDAPPDQRATVVRELVTSRGPALGPPKQPDCFDPKTVSPAPLAVLLPDRRDKFSARVGGSTRFKGRAAVVLELKPVAAEPPRVDWDRECGSIDL